MSSRDTLMRFEPVGGTPRMLVPVITTRSAPSSSSAGACTVSGGCDQAGKLALIKPSRIPALEALLSMVFTV
jgi:hypothetical protein